MMERNLIQESRDKDFLPTTSEKHFIRSRSYHLMTRYIIHVFKLCCLSKKVFCHSYNNLHGQNSFTICMLLVTKSLFFCLITRQCLPQSKYSQRYCYKIKEIFFSCKLSQTSKLSCTTDLQVFWLLRQRNVLNDRLVFPTLKEEVIQ